VNFSEYKKYAYNTIESVSETEVTNFIETLYNAYEQGSTVFVIGNGGSAANASHFAQDLAKGTRAKIDQPKCIKALSLTDNFAFFSALGNDEGYDAVFVEQMRTFSKSGDLLVAISGSGNSPNILRAVEYAKQNGIKTVGITGFGGGKLIDMVDEKVHVPINDMCTAESVHSVVFHYVILELHERMKAEHSN